jgi:hypothetical protein
MAQRFAFRQRLKNVSIDSLFSKNKEIRAEEIKLATLLLLAVCIYYFVFFLFGISLFI